MKSRTELEKQLKELEKTAAQLEPTEATRKSWNETISQFSDEFFDRLPNSKPFIFTENTGEAIKHFPLDEDGKEFNQILELLKEHMFYIALNAASPFHFGYVPGGGLFPTALGDYLAALTNIYAGTFFVGPGAVRMENKLIKWMCAFIGFPETAHGNLTSGGSIANLVGITTARDFLGIKAEIIPQAVIYLTQQTHHCVRKALRIAGLGESIIRFIPMDEGFRMDPAALEQQIREDINSGLRPFLLVGSAGTTDTGAIDPLEKLGNIAKQFNLWFHVDAAYGGFFMLVDSQRHKFKGIELSDSVVIDPHKGFFLSYGIGAVLVKNTEALFKSNYYQANYMQDAESHNQEISPSDLSPELTKHFRGLRMWLPIQLFGLAPFRAALEEKILLCQYFFQEIKSMGFEVGPEPDLSIMIYRYVPENQDINTFNKNLVHYIQKDGSVFVTSTTLNGNFWIRMAILSFRVHKEQVDTCLGVLKKGVNTLLEKVKV